MSAISGNSRKAINSPGEAAPSENDDVSGANAQPVPPLPVEELTNIHEAAQRARNLRDARIAEAIAEQPATKGRAKVEKELGEINQCELVVRPETPASKKRSAKKGRLRDVLRQQTKAAEGRRDAEKKHAVQLEAKDFLDRWVRLKDRWDGSRWELTDVGRQFIRAFKPEVLAEAFRQLAANSDKGTMSRYTGLIDELMGPAFQEAMADAQAFADLVGLIRSSPKPTYFTQGDRGRLLGDDDEMQAQLAAMARKGPHCTHAILDILAVDGRSLCSGVALELDPEILCSRMGEFTLRLGIWGRNPTPEETKALSDFGERMLNTAAKQGGTEKVKQCLVWLSETIPSDLLSAQCWGLRDLLPLSVLLKLVGPSPRPEIADYVMQRIQEKTDERLQPWQLSIGTLRSLPKRACDDPLYDPLWFALVDRAAACTDLAKQVDAYVDFGAIDERPKCLFPPADIPIPDDQKNSPEGIAAAEENARRARMRRPWRFFEQGLAQKIAALPAGEARTNHINQITPRDPDLARRIEAEIAAANSDVDYWEAHTQARALAKRILF